MTDEVKAAAELVSNRIKEYRENFGEPEEFGNSAALVADAYLREHSADEDTPIDEAWLRSVGGITYADFRFTGEVFFKQDKASIDCTRQLVACVCQKTADWQDEANRIASVPFPATRGQLRTLCRALGIKLEETGS
jgi:hypothetical protein